MRRGKKRKKKFELDWQGAVREESRSCRHMPLRITHKSIIPTIISGSSFQDQKEDREGASAPNGDKKNVLREEQRRSFIRMGGGGEELCESNGDDAVRLKNDCDFTTSWRGTNAKVQGRS